MSVMAHDPIPNPQDECPHCDAKEQAVDEVVDALWKMMREATVNFMPSPLDKNKAALKKALYKMMDQF